MKLIQQSQLIRKYKNLLFLLSAQANNTNNSDFASNGEAHFMKEIARFYSSKKKAFIFFDVGANIGEYSFLLDNLQVRYTSARQFFLFEPQKSCVQELNKKFSKKKYINVVNAAVSDRAGNMSLYSDKSKSSLASLHNRVIDLKKSLTHVEKVKVITLKQFINQNKIPYISLLKLDVEGHELAVLKGVGEFLSPHFIDFIQFEYGGANIDSRTYLRDLIILLQEKGFRVAKLYPNGIQNFTYTQKVENFQYQNFVAFSSKVLEK